MPSLQPLTDEEILEVAREHCAFSGEGLYHLNKYTPFAIVRVVRECFDLAELTRAALATQQAVQGEPVAFEFYNPTTGHAIVDYSRQTHVGPLTKEMGYEARPLGYINPPPAAMKPGDPVPLWQALEALDSLEESSRGDAPYNHFAAGLVRSALEQAAAPPAPGQVERDREDAENWRWWVGDAPKDVSEYLRGVREGWSVEQWSEWARAARSSEGGGNEHSR